MNIVKIAALSAACALASAPAQSAVAMYESLVDFSAVAGPTSTAAMNGMTLNQDVSNISYPFVTTSSVNASAFVRGAGHPYAVDGTRFVYVDLSAIGPTPGSFTLTFTTPITSFGADFVSLNNGVPRTYAVVAGTVFQPLPDSPNFLGFASTTPFTKVTFINPFGDPNNDQFGIDNLRYGSNAVTLPVPEPSTWAMMLAGVAIVGSAMRRRRTTLSFA